MSDDPTKQIDEQIPATPPTQPTIETVLQRLNDLNEKLGRDLAKVIAKGDSLTAEIAQLRAEMAAIFGKFDRKLDVLLAISST